MYLQLTIFNKHNDPMHPVNKEQNKYYIFLYMDAMYNTYL